MGFWNKLGKIALTAAPYVAAPFTGGASLMATGLANKAVQKWSEKDAQKNLAKGLAPSKFDQRLGKIGNIASTASMFIPGGQLGMLGKAGSAAATAGKVASTAGKVANVANKVNQGMNVAGQVVGALRNQNQSPIGPSQYPQQYPQQQPQYRGQNPNQGRSNLGTRGNLPPYIMNLSGNRRPQPSYAYGR